MTTDRFTIYDGGRQLCQQASYAAAAETLASLGVPGAVISDMLFRASRNSGAIHQHGVTITVRREWPR